jgi:outer membrane cobalamin receptor
MSPVLPYDGSVTIRGANRGKSIAVFLLQLQALLWVCGVAMASAWIGQPLSDALKSLQRRDFSIIFSTELVPDALRVNVEPRATDAPSVAVQLLAPYGLGLRRVGAGLYAVVRVAAGHDSAAASHSAGLPASIAVPLDQIVIAASRYTITGVDSGAYRIDRSVLDHQPKLADDALRVVARLPGVAGNNLSARLNIRGGDADEVLLLMDGFPIRQPFHVPALQGPFSTFDANTISQVDVYTGGFPLRYGERMSGVIDFSSIEPDQEPRHSLSASFFHVGARTAGILSAAHRVDGLVNLRAGNLRTLLDRLAPDVLAPIYADGTAKLRWRPSEATTVTAQAMYSRDAIAVRDVDRGELARLSSRARYVWLHLDRRINDRWRAEAWLGDTNLQSHREGQLNNVGIVQGFVDDERSADLWDFRWRMNGAIDERQSVEFGGEWHVGDGDYRYRSAALLAPAVAAIYGRDGTSRDLELAPFRRDLAVFAAYRRRLGTEATAELGFRLHRAAGLGLDSELLWDPRLMLSWDIGAKTQLRVSWGRFHQVDDVQELRVEDGALGFVSPQSSEHNIIGVQHVDARGIDWRAEIFRKTQSSPRPRYENQLNPLAILPELAPDRVLIGPDRAELRGLELSAAYQGRVWAWRLAYTWSDAIDDFAGVDYVRSWDQTHSFNAAVDWRWGPWTAAAAVALHTGWPTTQLRADANGELSLAPRNGARWPTYASLDLRGGYRLVLPRGELLFALDLTNALDRRNRCCSDLLAPSTGGPSDISIEPLSLLPATPSLSVRWNF